MLVVALPFILQNKHMNILANTIFFIFIIAILSLPVLLFIGIVYIMVSIIIVGKKKH